jgi:hypothetical protein
MVMQQRVIMLYTQLFHHPPDLGKTDDAAEYAILEAALREVVEACKQVAEQHASGRPTSPWGDGLWHAARKIAFAIDSDLGK